MNITKAKSTDLIDVFYLLKVCVKEMNSSGWVHWNLQFDMVRKDIEDGMLFLYKTDYHSLGMIAFSNEELPEYHEVQWSPLSQKPLIIRRLIVHPNWRKQGIVISLLTFAEEYARDYGFTSLRIDVYAENQEAISTYTNFHYQQTGEIQIHTQKVPFYCFEKTL